jgi:hypothetical protein
MNLNISMPYPIPPELTSFHSDDIGFIRWCKMNLDGFFLNCPQTSIGGPGRPYVLHSASVKGDLCPHFKNSKQGSGYEQNLTTNDYFKLCSTDRRALERWISVQAPAARLMLCSSCIRDAQPGAVHVWLLIGLGAVSQSLGSVGLQTEKDVELYLDSFDEILANAPQVARNDLVILGNAQFATGIARVVKGAGTIGRGSAGSLTLQQFRAFPEVIDTALLRPSSPEYIAGAEVQKFDFRFNGQGLWGSHPKTAALLDSLIPLLELSADEAAPDLPEDENGHEAQDGDTGDDAWRTVRARRGQRTFRNNLLSRYSSTCVVSGSKVLDVLEAAHISPYREARHNGVENGLILRSDLHTLFDLHLMGINPNRLTVHFHPSLSGSEYDGWEGRPLNIVHDKPSRRALGRHWAEFQKRIGSYQ